MSAAVSYAPRSTSRRTKAEIAALREAIYETCATHHPLTCRNLFYLLVTLALIQKSEADYRNVVLRLAGLMREEGVLPWDWLVDNTRLIRKPRSYCGLADLLEESAAFYRRDLWAHLDSYVEVWCESDSIGGALFDVTAEFDVPLMAAKGFSSKPFLYDTAGTIAYHDKPTTIYYVGDFDPSGVVARDDVERRLSRYLDRWHVHFQERFEFVALAVTADQVASLELPTKPPKIRKSTHATAAGWSEGQGTVEAEAIPPERMRGILRAALESHIPVGHLERMAEVESAERETLEQLAGQMRDGGGA